MKIIKKVNVQTREPTLGARGDFGVETRGGARVSRRRARDSDREVEAKKEIWQGMKTGT